MISLVEALNFRCLRYAHRPLSPFHVLVGPNGSGKTTFLDVMGFLGDMVSEGLPEAVSRRTANFDDLLWQRRGQRLELALEATIPEDRLQKLPENNAFDTIRYEVGLDVMPHTQEVQIGAESVLLKQTRESAHGSEQPEFFPRDVFPPESILSSRSPKNTKRVLNKVKGGNDNFYSETYDRKKGKGWAPSFRLGPLKSALGNLIDDETKFPVSTWFRSFLANGVQQITLNSACIQRPSPPGQPRRFRPDGSNLPWLIEAMKKETPDRFKKWIRHLRSALPDLESVETVEREEDRHRYLIACYSGGMRAPSWVVSDGTLRLMALTLLSYLPNVEGVYLIEEPENGIHPTAVSTVYQSLSSVYDAQVLIASHSPVILSEAKPSQTLCFAKSAAGSTDIVVGDEHPGLRDWRGDTDLGALFASGVLG